MVKTKTETVLQDPVVVVMLMGVMDTDEGGPGRTYAKGQRVTFPRAKAVAWVLRGFASPVGWEPTRGEVLAGGPSAYADIRTEGRRRGGHPDDPTGWLRVPMYRRRVEGLVRMLEGGQDDGPQAA